MKKQRRTLRIDNDGEGNLCVWLDGTKIAKRGRPGTPQAGTWVPLEPGIEVLDVTDTLIVKVNGVWYGSGSFH